MASTLELLKIIFLKSIEVFRERSPEKMFLLASYIVNTIMIALQFIMIQLGGEKHIGVLLSSIAAASQLYLPFFMMSFTPLIHVVVVAAILVAGLATRLFVSFPVYYYLVTVALPLSVIKLDPAFDALVEPVTTRVRLKVNRALKKARLPASSTEFIVDLKLSSIYMVGIAIALAVFFYTANVLALGVLMYNALIVLSIFLHISAYPEKKGHSSSLSLLFVMRYPFAYRIVENLKLKIYPLVERSGRLIYIVGFLSKFVTIFILYIMFVPTIALTLMILLPSTYVALSIPILIGIAVLLYQMPFILVKSYIGARRRRTEKEYPFFVAYVTTMVTSGLNLYQALVRLASTKGRELLRGFSEEGRYLRSLVEHQGYPEIKALEKYATLHPNDEVRNFVLGYVYQVQMGGKIALYLEQKLSEAIDITKRKLELTMRYILLLTEIAIMILVVPTMPMMLGFILSPESVFTVVVLYMTAIIPVVGLLFYNAATMVQPPYRNKYVFKYVPSMIGALVGLVLSTVFLRLDIAVATAATIAAGAIGHYIEFLRQQRIFSDIEKALPNIFRDLAELRNLMSIPEAIRKMAGMNYPSGIKNTIVSWARQRDLGIKLSEQPLSSPSWFMKFTQFLVGEIEECGGGTPQLFRLLMNFFTEYKNIMFSLRSNLRVYEVTVWIIPLILGLIMQVAIGIFALPKQSFEGINLELLETGAGAVGLDIAKKMFGGIDPLVITLSNLMIIETSFILGLLTGKMTAGTIHNTKNLAIVMILTILVLLAAPYLIQMFVGGIGGTGG